MRVAAVAIETAHHRETAVTARFRAITRRLAQRGHDVTTFCARWWGGDLPAFESDGVTYRAIVPDLTTPSRRLFTRLPAAIRAVDPAVILATSPDSRAILAAGLAASLARTPLVVDWYEVPPPPSRWAVWLRRVAARIPAVVVTPSRLVRTDVHELGRPVEDIRVIPTGIDMARIRAIDPVRRGDIVYSRQLDADANLGSLLLALAELRSADWTATIIGDGHARAGYEQQARELRIDDRVAFVGDQSLDRRLACFKGAHVAVHTALTAPFPTDFLRALACGCVGIAEYHARSAATELIERRERGFRTTSPEELAAAIRSAAALPRRSVDESFAEFDVEAVLDEYLASFRSIG